MTRYPLDTFLGNFYFNTTKNHRKQLLQLLVKLNWHFLTFKKHFECAKIQKRVPKLECKFLGGPDFYIEDPLFKYHFSQFVCSSPYYKTKKPKVFDQNQCDSTLKSAWGWYLPFAPLPLPPRSWICH